MNYLASNDMKPKFEIGDRVRYNELEGVIVGIDAEPKRYLIQYEDDDDKYCVKEDWIEFANPRTAFLTRLQELLATFDAEICAIIGEDDATNGDKPVMWIQIGDEVVNYERGLDGCDITAKNVFDYDKD